jgi:Tfp pilus assembly protein PilN
VKAVNLLPNDLRGASKTTAERVTAPEATGGAGPFVILGILAALVAGIAGYVLTQNTVAQSKAELAQVQARRQALAGQAAKLKPYADFDALAKTRVQTVRDLAGSRFDWEQAVRDLARAIPANVTLKTLSGNVSADTGSGGGSGTLRGAIAAPAITITGCTPGQTDVARLMARLRDIEGVTRVSLSKSDAQKYEADSGSGSEIARRNAAPCGTGMRPQFEIVMFFETAPAAVSASPGTGGGSATAAATPTPTPTATPAGTEATNAPTTTTAGQEAK